MLLDVQVHVEGILATVPDDGDEQPEVGVDGAGLEKERPGEKG